MHGESALALRASMGVPGKTVEYTAWLGMKQRCYDPNVRCFARYGGRGINVCDRWLHSFSAFLADMGRRPSPSHSLDRIDNDGDYEPGNCRWATHAEQVFNRSTNRRYTFAGKTMPAHEWAKELDISLSTLRSRIHRGYSPDRIFSSSLEPTRRPGVRATISRSAEWAARKKKV
jgi:hypothetical protein